MARQKELMEFHLNFGKMEVHRYTASSTNSLSVIGNKANCQKTSGIQSLLPYTKIKENSLTALTTGGSLHTALQEKFLLVCS